MTRHYDKRTLAAAAVLAVAAAILTALYVGSGDASGKQTGGSLVYVASRDIPRGTVASDLVRRHLVALRRVPSESLAAAAIQAPAQLRGLVSVEPIYHGEQLTLRRFETARAQGVLADLRGDLRAIRLAGTPDQLLAGDVRDGDRVDVVAFGKAGREEQPVARIVLRDLLVLRAPAASASSGGLGSPGSAPASATLRLTDRQAEALFFVEKSGDWSLVLRPVVHPTQSGGGGVSADAVLLGSR